MSTADKSKSTKILSSIPSLHAFDPDTTTWSSYRDRMTFYFQANNVTLDPDRKPLFLWSIGNHVYTLLESLVAPRLLTEPELTYIGRHNRNAMTICPQLLMICWVTISRRKFVPSLKDTLLRPLIPLKVSANSDKACENRNEKISVNAMMDWGQKTEGQLFPDHLSAKV